MAVDFRHGLVMDPSEAWPEETLFDRALQLPSPEARRAFLDELGHGNPALRGRIESLLAAHDAPRGIPPRKPTAAQGRG